MTDNPIHDEIRDRVQRYVRERWPAVHADILAEVRERRAIEKARRAIRAMNAPKYTLTFQVTDPRHNVTHKHEVILGRTITQRHLDTIIKAMEGTS